MDIAGFFKRLLGKGDSTDTAHSQSSAPTAPTTSAPSDSTHVVASSGRILIVDDSRTQIVAIQKWLESEGYDTLSALNGKEGIKAVQEDVPDLILMDIVMPEVNGFQATRYLKKHDATKNIPIILMSGEEQSSGKLWGKKLGAADFMVKPLNKDILLARIAELVTDGPTGRQSDYSLSSLDAG